jgi:glycosyltransferase involved in cell wall biosynthesis
LLGRRDDVSHVLAACDLFVLASKNEGLPIALVEALALGLPVVATAVGGTPEVVTDGLEGLLVPPSNPDQLASAIERLLADPELRARMSAAATERARHFDISRSVAEMESIYRTLTPDLR